MPRITTAHLRAARWAALPIALVASGLLVAQASSAAFTSSTDNAANSWRTGSVQIGDDDQSAAMFDETDLQPGASGARCIVVESNGSLDSSVKLFAASPTGSGLADAVALRIAVGNGGSFGDCDGFVPLAAGADLYDGTLAGLVASATDHASGLGEWVATQGDTRTYRIDWSVDADADNTTQGSAAGIDFVWEAQDS